MPLFWSKILVGSVVIILLSIASLPRTQAGAAAFVSSMPRCSTTRPGTAFVVTNLSRRTMGESAAASFPPKSSLAGWNRPVKRQFIGSATHPLVASSSVLFFSSSSRGPNVDDSDDGDHNENGDNNIHQVSSDGLTWTTMSQEEKEQLEEYDKSQRIFLLMPKYGYRITPFSWQELHQICRVEQDYAKLSRSVPQQYAYQLSLQETKARYKTVNDHILCSKFGFDAVSTTVGPNDGDTTNNNVDDEQATRECLQASPSLAEIVQQLKDQKKTNNNEQNDDTKIQESSYLAVVPNEFPYFVADNVQHWLLWKLGPDLCTAADIEMAKQTIHKRVIEAAGAAAADADCKNKNNNKKVGVLDFIHWTNPPHLKSIPDIDHVHILCLVQEDDKEEDKEKPQ